MASDKPLIFVSCGQYAESEKQLGREICSLLTELRPDVTPYFAEDQSTAEGLSNHVLKALHRAAGFICVMHRRGDLTAADGRELTRGSVWVEQEIAITAFIHHVLNRSVPTFFYKQAGVSVEGIRSVLLMNPRVEFKEDCQILQDLRSALPRTAFTPFNSYDVEPVLHHRRLVGQSTGDRHRYTLICDVRNTGTERVTDFKMRIFFPRAFLDPTQWSSEERKKSTTTHICFAADMEGRAPGGLYPGDGLTHPLEFEYFVDDALFQDPSAIWNLNTSWTTPSSRTPVRCGVRSSWNYSPDQ